MVHCGQESKPPEDDLRGYLGKGSYCTDAGGPFLSLGFLEGRMPALYCEGHVLKDRAQGWLIKLLLCDFSWEA